MSELSCATAPSPPSGTIDWGDGQTSPASYTKVGGSGTPQYAISGSHTYREEGTYAGTARSTYSCSGPPSTVTTLFTAQVSDAALSAIGNNVTATTGQQFSGPVASFTDADPAGTTNDYSAQIDWGDGTGAGAGTVGASGGGFSVSGSHTYASAGTYTVMVKISDAGGATAQAQDTATAGAPPANATFTPSTGAPALGRPVTFDASGSRSPGTTVKSFAWNVNGAPQALCAGATSQMTTRFLSPGTKSITLRVTDSAGNVTSTSHNITVTGRPFSARRGSLVMHAQQVFNCHQGPSDDHNSRVAPDVPSAPGDGCTTQIQSGIIDAVGCLTENQDPVELFTKTIYVAPASYTEQNLVAPTGSLGGVPGPQLGQLLWDIEQEAFPNDYLQLCAFPRDPHNKALTDAQTMYCSKAPGEGMQTPPSNGGNGGSANVGGSSGGFGCAEATCPPPAADVASATSASARTRQNNGISFYAPPCDSSPQPAGTSGGEAVSTLCLDLYTSTGPVRINGIDYVPEPGTTLIIAPQYNLIVASSASTWLDALRLQAPNPVNDQLPSPSQGAGAAPGAARDTAMAHGADAGSGGAGSSSGSGSGKDYPALSVNDLQSLLSHQPNPQTAAQIIKLLSKVGGFPTVAGLEVTFDDNFNATITVHAKLPDVFSSGGPPPTAAISAEIGPTVPFQIQFGYFTGSANFGAVALKNFAICYRHKYSSDTSPSSTDPCPGITGITDNPGFGDDLWVASGVFDVSGAGFSLVFRPGGDIPTTVCPGFLNLGFGFGDGKVRFAGAALVIANGGLQLGAGITLQQLGASFTALPTYDTVCAYTTLGAFENFVQLTGEVFAVWTKDGGQYQFTGSELGTTKSGSPYLLPSYGGDPPHLEYPYTNGWALGIGASVSLNLPQLGQIEFADGYALYVNDPGALWFGAEFDLGLPSGNFEDQPGTGIAFKGGIAGAVGSVGGKAAFWVEGNAAVALNVLCSSDCSGNVFSASLDAIISDAPGEANSGGIAICGSLDGGTVGVGYHWGDGFSQLPGDFHSGGSCSDGWFGEFRVAVQPAAASDARARTASVLATVVHVPRGAPAADIEFIGRGGAPDVTITGPGGFHESTAGPTASGHFTRRGSLFYERMSMPSTYTFIGLLHPRPGTYRVTLNPGSPPVATVMQKNSYVPSVTARVTGSGIHRRLEYTVKPVPGQRIEFLERSNQVLRQLGQARGRTGSISFTATPGPQRRQILANIYVDGAAGPALAVASYQPSGRVRLHAVRKLRVRRSGARATVSWAKVPNALSYAVSVVLSDGDRRFYITRAPQLTISGVFLEIGGHVSISAHGDSVFTLSGPTRTAALPPAVRYPRGGVRTRLSPSQKAAKARLRKKR